MENSIAKTVRSCMRAFQSLSAAVLESSDQQNHSLGDMSPEWAKDRFDRFKLWSQNIGAHRTGTSSLDYRLRDASNLRKQAIDLVGDLAQALEDATSIISGVRIPWDMEQPSKEGLASDSMSLSSASEDDETSVAVDSELTQIMMDVVDIIDCLLRLSVSVQNPAPHDRLKATTTTNTSIYEADDIKNVSAKFNSAEKWQHVGRHQEELALFALPKLDVPDERGQEVDESISGGLDSEHDDFRAESQSSDEDEHAQESIEYSSHNDEIDDSGLPLMSCSTLLDSATHEQLVSTVRDAVDDDQENVQDRKSKISAGHGERIDQQRLELPREAEEHPRDDGSIGSSHNHHQRGRPRDESHRSSHSHRHSSHSSSRSPLHRGSDADLTVELNETRRRSTMALDEEEEYSRRPRDQLRKRSKKEEVNQENDRLKARFGPRETLSDASRQSSSEAPGSSRRMRQACPGRPYIERLGPAAARPTSAIPRSIPRSPPRSPSAASPERRFDGPVAVSKTGQPAISHYQGPAYSSTPRSAGMERPTVSYKHDPTAGHDDGNYNPHPL